MWYCYAHGHFCTDSCIDCDNELIELTAAMFELTEGDED